jgi:hypothetical protein
MKRLILFLSFVIALCSVCAAQDKAGQTQDAPLDSKRIGFAPTAARFANLASQDTSGWSGLPGQATVTTGVKAPDGTTAAATLSVGSPVIGGRFVYSSNRTLKVGDRLVVGVWVRAVSLDSGSSAQPSISLDGQAIARITADDPTQGYQFDVDGLNYRDLKASDKADTQWEWVTTAIKVVTAPSTPTATVKFELQVSNGRTLAFYAPLLHHVVADEMTDDEAASFLQNLYSVPDGVPVGAVALLRGQALYCYQGGVYGPCASAGSGPWINLTTAGLTCDGSADDSSALTSLIASTPAGSTFFVPANKNCRLNSTVTFNKRIHIRGEGLHSAFSCQVGSGNDCIVYDPGGTDIMDGVILKDFAIVGTSSRNALVWRSITRSEIDNVFIGATTASDGYGFRGEGILINHIRVHVTNSLPYPFTAGAPGNGILLTGSSFLPSNANLLLNCIVEHGPGKGIFIDGATGTPGTTNNWIIGGTIEGGMEEGIHLKNANYSTIMGVHVEDTVAPAFSGAKIVLENTSNTTIGQGVSIGASLDLINADDCAIDGITVDSVNIDSSSQRNRIGLVQYGLNCGSFTDHGVDTTYMGQIANACNGNAVKTGTALAAASMNLLQNGGGEYWNGGQPTDWGVSSGSLTKTGTGQADTRKKFGDFAAKTASGIQYVLVDVRQPELSQILDQPITLSAWVYIPSGQGTQPNVVLQVWYDGGATAYSGDQTNVTDTWVHLEFAARVPSTATQVELVLQNTASGAGGLYYIDGLSIVFGKAGPPTEAPRILRWPALELRTPTMAITKLFPTASSDLSLNLPSVTGTLTPYISTGGDFFASWNSAANALETAPIYKLGSASVFMGGALWNTDNASDIGASGSNRPRSVYAGTSFIGPIYSLGGGISWSQGAGTPEGNLTGSIGALYSRNNGSGGSTLYVKESGGGNTGWSAVLTSGGASPVTDVERVQHLKDGYSCAGDGTTDDTTCFGNAISAANSSATKKTGGQGRRALSPDLSRATCSTPRATGSFSRTSKPPGLIGGQSSSTPASTM